MANKWLESFDLHVNATDWPRKYEAVSGTAAATGTNRLVASGGNSFLISSATPSIFRTKDMGLNRTWFLGIAIKPSFQGAEACILRLQNGVNEQVSLWVVQGSTSSFIKFRVKRGSTTLGTTANEWNINFWIYVELKTILDTNGTDGTVEIKINEAVELTVPGTDTTNYDTDRNANKVQFELRTGASGTTLFDDVYINDNNGGVNDTYWGDTAVEGKAPTGEGNRNQWTPNSGSVHWNRVSETTTDDDATYLSIANNVDGMVELFAIADIVGLVTNIYAVQVSSQHRMDSSGTDKFRYIFRAGGGTEATTSDKTVTSIAGYEWFQQNFDVDPTTAAAWTVTNFNAMQMGVESRP